MTYPPQPGQPYQQPVPPPQPAKKKRKWPWIVLAVIAVIVVISVASKPDKAKEGFQDGLNAGAGTSQAPAEAPAAIPPLTAAPASGEGTSITYEVISDSGELNSVTWFDEMNALQQDSNVAAPWSMVVNNTASFSMAGVTAQTTGQSVTCRVVVDGKVEEEKTSTGQYAVVNCSYAGF